MKSFKEFMNIAEGFTPMNIPKMQTQQGKHLANYLATNKRDKKVNPMDNRVSNIGAVIRVIGPQQNSKTFKEKKTEKGKRAFAKNNAYKFLTKDDLHGAKDRLGYDLTVPNRHISRDEEGHKKHIERLKKKI